MTRSFPEQKASIQRDFVDSVAVRGEPRFLFSWCLIITSFERVVAVDTAPPTSPERMQTLITRRLNRTATLSVYFAQTGGAHSAADKHPGHFILRLPATADQHVARQLVISAIRSDGNRSAVNVELL
jgi:hypothetical protein